MQVETLFYGERPTLLSLQRYLTPSAGVYVALFGICVHILYHRKTRHLFDQGDYHVCIIYGARYTSSHKRGAYSPGLERAATVIYLINKSVVHEVLHFTAYLFFISSSVAADELVVSRINKYLPTAQSLT